MATSTWGKFEQHIEDVWHGKHDYSADTFKYALVAAANAPDLAADAILGDLTEISYTNLTDDGPGSRAVAVASSGQTSGTYQNSLTDFTITASGGAIAAFRYLIVYNDDQTSPVKPLVGRLDYGADVTLGDGESIDIDFAAATLSDS